MDTQDFSAWAGRSQVERDVAGGFSARALAATFDRPAPDDVLPDLIHWLHFLPVSAMAEVGPDGHPKRGGFLPPVPLPRRMWAAGRLTFHAPIRSGDALERHSTILKVSQKTGSTGAMVFVTVGHKVMAGGALAVEEEQDIVYLPMPERFSPPAPTPLPEALDWQEARPVDPVLLFRFSALTFNGHRIHYDLPYAQEVEKYPGLVVHGPLQAMWLHFAACRHQPQRRAKSFAFRAIRPLFAHDTITLSGKGDETFTANAEGAIGMKATSTWQES
jgi:3-methylfumaryl-CoA hydratase